MSALSRLVLLLVVATAALMVLPGTSLVNSIHVNGASDGAAASATGTTSPVARNPLQAADLRARAALTADGVPSSEQLLPSFDPAVTVQNGQISPGSSLAPEPMGIADYGISDVDGTNVGSIYYTPTVKGVLQLDTINLQYPDSYGPDEFTSQLNSVATGITVQGDTHLQFWTQNVIYYFESDSTLHLASAIVNFTGTSFNFPDGTILGGQQYIDPGFGYFYPYGPSIYAPSPFTIAFFTNLTVLSDHPAVYFNYSVTSAAGTQSGSYSLVVFNGTVSPSALPAFQINGEALGATGYIPNDVELILGGDGGGSTTSALGISGTMNLYIQPNGTTRYEEVPEAYDFGSETGETIEDMAEWASGGSNPTVHFGAGPSVQQPLWGVAGAPAFGHTTIIFDVSPANAFVFGSIGTTFDPDSADWAYVPTDGIAHFFLPRESYSFEVLLSGYDPVTLSNVRGGTETVTLASDPATGIYTPLWAHGNAELAAISQSGAGTVRNPYVLENGPVVPMNPLFGQYNDYMFPVFQGVLLANTNAYVVAYDEAPFEVSYSLASEQFYAGVLPLDNQLSWFLDGTTHVTVLDNLDIGGYFSYAIYGGASLVLWNSSDALIAANTFEVASVGIIEFGGTGNTIWGNVFETVLPSALDPGYVLNYGAPVALYLYEAGDLIYNNYFGTAYTAFTPEYNPYDWNYTPEVWTDRWNVVEQPATDVKVVNGFALSGSILGLSYEGGNYWSNYGTQSDPYGVLPYDNGGNIGYGGDHVPLEPFALYAVTFTEHGLPSGTLWNVTLNGITESSTHRSITFWDPVGVYAYTIGNAGVFVPHPAIGAVNETGVAETVAVHFT